MSLVPLLHTFHLPGYAGAVNNIGAGRGGWGGGVRNFLGHQSDIVYRTFPNPPQLKENLPSLRCYH